MIDGNGNGNGDGALEVFTRLDNCQLCSGPDPVQVPSRVLVTDCRSSPRFALALGLGLDLVSISKS